jgi:hypothetical protein
LSVLVRGVFAIEPVVAVRCQRWIESSDQAMSVISWWYPHRVDGALLAGVARFRAFWSDASLPPNMVVVAVRC